MRLKRRRPTKKNNKINARKTRKGGMWRLTPKKDMPQAEPLNYAIAQPLRGNYDGPIIEMETGNAYKGKYDNPTREEELSDLYEDINKNGFPMYTNQIQALLKKYPEFDVNMKPDFYNTKRTMLNKSIYQSTPGLAQTIINNPTISEETLEEELQYINSLPKLNKSQTKIKQMIEDKLRNMRENNPSVPVPSAPPLEDDNPY
jgi:hypothetical protein